MALNIGFKVFKYIEVKITLAFYVKSMLEISVLLVLYNSIE